MAYQIVNTNVAVCGLTPAEIITDYRAAVLADQMAHGVDALLTALTYAVAQQ